jgi:Na+-driven multidrug efflux pump
MQLININAAIIIFQAVSSTCISGVLRGGADTKVVLLLDALSLWCCAVPLAWLGSYVWHLSPVVVYIFTRIDIFVKLIFAMRRLKEDKWMNNITENQMLGSI